MVDELGQCQQMLSGAYLMQIIDGFKTMQKSTDVVDLLHNMPKAAGTLLTAFKALLK